MQTEDGNLKISWVKVIFVAVSAALSMSAYVYSNFETKEHAKETTLELKETLLEIKSDIKWLRENHGTRTK